jgi:hypothetical protein
MNASLRILIGPLFWISLVLVANQSLVAAEKPTRATAQGYWNVIIDREGIYELELRRWPKESSKTLTEAYKGPQAKDASARPIAAANVQVAGANYTLDTQANDAHATFHIKLPAGKTQLTTTLMDSEDRALCSAIYVYLKRIEDSGVKDIALTPTSNRKPTGVANNNPRKAKVGAIPAKPINLAEGDIVLADFEGETYGQWTVTGTAFGIQPSGPKNRVNGHQGQRLVDTFLINESDKPTGTLTSPLFKVERKYINFLIGGGMTPGKTCVNLMVNGKSVRTAVGSATKDSQNRKILRWVSWDTGDLIGKEARVVIVDQASGGWGHIVVDHIFLSDTPATEGTK